MDDPERTARLTDVATVLQAVPRSAAGAFTGRLTSLSAPVARSAEPQPAARPAPGVPGPGQIVLNGLLVEMDEPAPKRGFWAWLFGR